MTDYTTHTQKLEEQLATITTALSAIGTHDSENDNWEAIPNTEELAIDADENTNADSVEDWNERRATLVTLEREYRDIKRALHKIATGTYGVCEIGGEPIEAERLAYRPDARTCTAHMNEEGQLPL
jgi:DnaK suppressor protein